MIIVEGTQAQQIGAVTLELDARSFGQPLQRNLRLQPLDLRLGDAGHNRVPPKTCQVA